MSGRIELNGVSLYIQSGGKGPTVVLLHGMPLDHRMWDRTYTVLQRHYHTIRYDLRDVGRSGDGEGPFAHHDDLRALLETLEVDHASIVGISVGGKIAIDYALRYPNTVCSLVLINPGVSGYRWSDAFLANKREIQRLREEGRVEQALERFLQTWVEGPFCKRSEVIPSVRQYVRQTVLDYWKRESKGIPHFPPAVDRLAEIGVPTLVIRGDRDWEEIQTLAQRIASAIGVDYDGGDGTSPTSGTTGFVSHSSASVFGTTRTELTKSGESPQKTGKRLAYGFFRDETTKVSTSRRGNRFLFSLIVI